MNVICYTRVNSKKQADKGPFLQYQESVLRSYCEWHNFNIVDFYADNCSGRTFNRPEWNRLMGFVKQNKGKVDLILCLSWDRFANRIPEALTTIMTLNELGVEVNTIEQPIDFTESDHKAKLQYFLLLGEIESELNSFRMHKRKKGAKTI